MSEVPSSLEPPEDDEVPGRSACGCKSPPALAHELTTLELSRNDSEDDASVRIGDRPASRHRQGRRPLFVSYIIGVHPSTKLC